MVRESKRCAGIGSEGRSRRCRAFARGAVMGAALAYLLDPERGRSRRRAVVERTTGGVRRSGRRLARGGRATFLQALGHAKGVLHRLLPPPPREPLDDAGLAHKVESVLFRDPRVPKGRISVNAEAGAVFLRGQLESAELIDEIAASAAKIAGVRKVVNLLHLPGTAAPHPRGGRLLAQTGSGPTT